MDSRVTFPASLVAPSSNPSSPEYSSNELFQLAVLRQIPNQVLGRIRHGKLAEARRLLPPPTVKHPADPVPIRLEIPVFEHDPPHLVRLDPRVAVPFPAIRREEQLPQARKHLPVVAESVD